jgi:hypothetical protein
LDGLNYAGHWIGSDRWDGSLGISPVDKIRVKVRPPGVD